MSTIRKVHLFGVRRHGYQIPNDQRYRELPEVAREEFRHAVEIAISQYGIAGIAEEMSLEALNDRCDSNESVLCRLASKMCLPYCLCDLKPLAPNHQRERIWSDQLNRFNVFPVLFALAYDHVDSFESLLAESTFEPSIIERNWKAPSDPFSDPFLD